MNSKGMKIFGFLIGCFLLIPGAIVYASEYFVDPVVGSDASDGSQESPWKTLQHAACIVDPGDTVTAASGEYRESVQFYNSGAPESYITFRSAEHHGAVVKCSDVVSGWEMYSGNIYRASIDWTPMQVFRDGKLAVLARYPDYGEPYLRADGGGSTFLIDEDLDQPDGYWVGAVLRFACDQNEYTRRVVTSYTRSSHKLEWQEPIEKVYNGSPYWLEGLQSEVTCENEWFYNNLDGYIYYDFGETPPSGAVVEASSRMSGFILRNVEYIRIEGFDIRHGNATFGYGGGIFLENASNCIIMDNSCTEALSDGIFLLDHSNYNLIKDNDLNINGRSGIYLYSDFIDGPSWNRIVGNRIYDTGVNSLDGPGIAVTNGAYNVVSANSIKRAAGSSITFVGAGCIENQIESNEIFDSSLTSSDRGAISVYQTGGGNLIKSNLVVDTWGWDELQRKYWGCGIIVDKTNYELVVGNVVTGSHGYGINVHKSSGNQILNNTCAYNGYLNWHTQFVLEYDLSADNIVENNVGISGEGQNVFAVTAGAENASGNICDYNCWFRVGTEDIIKWGDIFNLTLEEFRNVSGQGYDSINKNPLLVAPDSSDCRLTADSPCIDKGMDVGLPYVGSSPDIGAYEFGAQPPLLASIGNRKAVATYLFRLFLSATDPDGDEITYFGEDLPEGSRLNGETGLFIWRPSPKDTGKSWNVTFYAYDGELFDSEEVTISVEKPVKDPVIVPGGVPNGGSVKWEK